jgi:hypothetical protein
MSTFDTGRPLGAVPQGAAAGARIGPSVQIKGEINGSEDLEIHGSVEGTIALEERRLTIGPTAKVSADLTAREILNEAAQQLATLAAAVRDQLFDEGEPARVSYIGGVWRSRTVLERFRALAELQEGNSVAPPVYGPAAGALLEAYRAAGVQCALSDVPVEKA